MRTIEAVFMLNRDDGDCMVSCEDTGLSSQGALFSPNREQIRIINAENGAQEACIEVPETVRKGIKTAFLVEVTDEGQPIRSTKVEVVK